VRPDLLVRTNRSFPRVWLSLSATPGAAQEGWLERLVGAAAEAGTVIDIGTNPGLWGGPLRGTDAILMAAGGIDVENATDERHAADLLQAHLIQTLCAIGREHLDFYFLKVRRGLEEYQIAGALQALEMARAEGHVRHIGLSCDGPALAVLGVWQFHDAFEALLVPRSHRLEGAYRTLAPLASERRVGIVTSRPLDWGHGIAFTDLPAIERLAVGSGAPDPAALAGDAIADMTSENPVLVPVRSPDEVRAALQAPQEGSPERLRQMLDELLKAYEEDTCWEGLELAEDVGLRDAARRRQSSARGRHP
jgi:hypothetical protein